MALRSYDVILPVSGMVVFNGLKKRDRQKLLTFSTFSHARRLWDRIGRPSMIPVARI